MAEYDLTRSFGANVFSFNVGFEEFITLYRGIENVWIGDGQDHGSGVEEKGMVNMTSTWYNKCGRLKKAV